MYMVKPLPTSPIVSESRLLDRVAVALVDAVYVFYLELVLSSEQSEAAMAD